jgi:hypothetical protein
LSVSHLTVTLRMMSNNRRSVSSIGLYMYDRFFNRYVTPQMKKLIMTLLAA